MELPQTRRIDPKNRIILPKAAMMALKAKPGDEVRYDVSNGRVTIRLR